MSISRRPESIHNDVGETLIGVDEDECCYNCNRTIPLLISHFPMRGAGELGSSIIVHYVRRHILHVCRLDDRVTSVPFFARHDRSFPCFPCVRLASGSSALFGHVDPIGFLIVLMAERHWSDRLVAP